MSHALNQMDTDFENQDPNKVLTTEEEEKRLDKKQEDIVQYEYKLIAKFRGHRNNDPPTIYYVP